MNTEPILNIDFILTMIEEDRALMPVLKKELADNLLLTQDSETRYANYDTQNRGCNPKNPFHISYTGPEYVHLEYDFMEYLFSWCMDRILDYEIELEMQSLTVEDGRHMDCLKYKVTNMETNEVTEEEYWFDIEEGFSCVAIDDSGPNTYKPGRPDGQMEILD